MSIRTVTGFFRSLRDFRYPRKAEQEHPLQLTFWNVLFSDIRAAQNSNLERVGIDRARRLQVSALFMLWSHLALGGTVLWAAPDSISSSGIVQLAILLSTIITLDLALLWIAKRNLKHYTVTRWAIGYAVASAAVWTFFSSHAATLILPQNAGALTVALAGGYVFLVFAFLSVPAIVVFNSGIAIAAVALLNPAPLLLACLLTSNAALVWFSISSARSAILTARGRYEAEWEARKAQSFLREFEESGRGWYWETDGEAALCYVSKRLAAELQSSPAMLLGRALAEIVNSNEELVPQQALSKFFSTKLPFSDIPVRPNIEKEMWWSVSGRPVFDEHGAFLGFRGIGSDLTEKRRQEAEITRLAHFDSLTQLPNRSYMRQMLVQALENLAHRQAGCGLFLIDLDRFKAVNDTLGHPMGDALLREVANRLTKALGASAQIGRIGGDEFEALFPGVDHPSMLGELADRLIVEVSKPYEVEGQKISIGASIGIAIAPKGEVCADELIRKADLALYEAKATGRGTFRFFEERMLQNARRRRSIENELRNGLAQQRFRLAYQPIIHTNTEELVGFEALLRWEHPEFGSMTPIEFVPIAEDRGLIGSIGEWVLHTACAEAANWPAHLRLAVNVSPVQFSHSSLLDVTASALTSGRITADRLELEVTERVFLGEHAMTEEILKNLKSLGVRLVLDDFGTGYSSLGYLREGSFDKIKIDQSFLRTQAKGGSRNAALVKAIVTMAEDLGIETTAEGVETAEELAFVRRLGCSQIQGFMYGRPMTAEQAMEYIDSGANASLAV